jgi:hypothetical protein
VILELVPMLAVKKRPTALQVRPVGVVAGAPELLDPVVAIPVAEEDVEESSLLVVGRKGHREKPLLGIEFADLDF